MGLEDMPSVQILEYRDNVRLDFNKHPSYNGKFVTIRDGQGRHYFFSIVSSNPNEPSREHKDLVYVFNANAFDEHKIPNPQGEFNVTGGGKIKLSSKFVVLYDKSEKYGKFNASDIKSILSEYASKNLPKHKISYE